MTKYTMLNLGNYCDWLMINVIFLLSNDVKLNKWL